MNTFLPIILILTGITCDGLDISVVIKRKVNGVLHSEDLPIYRAGNNQLFSVAPLPSRLCLKGVPAIPELLLINILAFAFLHTENSSMETA